MNQTNARVAIVTTDCTAWVAHRCPISGALELTHWPQHAALYDAATAQRVARGLALAGRRVVVVPDAR